MYRLIWMVLLVMSCADPIEPEIVFYDMSLNARLVSNEDGFYELTLDLERTQTIHRISGHVYIDGQPLEYQRVVWLSSHSWILGTLVVIVRKKCPYSNDDVICIWYITGNGSARDTLFLTQFDGEEIPTVNGVSISAADGEINTVFAPTGWMIGDTVTIIAIALFPDGDVQDSLRIILR